MNGHQWQTIRQRQVSGADRARQTSSVPPARLQRDLLSLAATRRAEGHREDLIPTVRRMAASPSGYGSVLRLQRCCGNQNVQKILRIGRNEPDGTITKPQVEDAIDSARGGGAALDSGVRAQMESSFGADF